MRRVFLEPLVGSNPSSILWTKGRRSMSRAVGCCVASRPSRLSQFPDLRAQERARLVPGTGTGLAAAGEDRRRDRLALRRSQTVKAPDGPFQFGIESADAQPNQRCLHSVDNPTSLADEALALAARALGILVL